MSENLAGIKADVSGLISTWGKRCIVSRLSSTLTTSGRTSGSFMVKSSGTFWVQPKAGYSKRSNAGLLEDTSHLLLARLSASLLPEDRVLPSGDTYSYDVLDVAEWPTHYLVQMKRVKRT